MREVSVTNNYKRRDTEEEEHIGFHIYLHEKPGIYYGRMLDDGTVSCTVVSRQTVINLYTLVKEEGNVPYCHYIIQGVSGHCPVSEFAMRLKSFGIPFTVRETRDLTNALLNVSRSEDLYSEPGYVLRVNENETFRRRKKIEKRLKGVGENQGETEEIEAFLESDEMKVREIRLLTPRNTPQKYDNPNWVELDLDEVVPDLYNLYNLTDDKKAFLIAFSYSLFSPFASAVRKRRLFFPNLIFLGLPETGKNSLLNLFLAKMWEMETNIKVTGDFKSEYASMFNLSGSGIPIVINDLDQVGYDKLKPYLLEGAMNPKGGSRGRPTLEVREFETSRGIAISSNYLRIGAVENTSRFFIHVLSFGDEMRNEEWNATAARLRGSMYPIARHFINFINRSMDADTFLGYFQGSRKEVKQTVLDFGARMLRELFRRVDPAFKLPAGIEKYEEYEEDHFSLFLGWVQLSLRKMQKETNYTSRDYDAREVITVRYEDSLYIREEEGKYVVFPMAWADFLRKYPEFPFKSMESFAHAYPDYVKAQPRKFRVDAKGRSSFRVLIIGSSMQQDVVEQKEQAEEAVQ
jgi:hypothetical protein